MTAKCPTGGGGVGWIIGESTPEKSLVLFRGGSNPRTGAYLLVETPEGCVLGVLERVFTGNLIIGDKVRDQEEMEAFTKYPDLRDKTYWYGAVQWLALLDPLLGKGVVQSPSMPAEPGAEVYRAPASALSLAFQGGGPEWVEIGSLVSEPSVRFSINVNKLGRHLAILAVTGGGKSNTVCVMARRIVEGLNGTIVLFDMHGEYAAAGDSLAPGRVSVKEPKINPFNLSFPELLRIARVPENAHNQERILREAYKKIMEDFRRGAGNVRHAQDYLGLLAGYAKRSEAARDKKDSLNGVLNRIEDIRDYYGDVLDLNAPVRLTHYIEPGKLNIIDLSGVDEFGADAVVSHYLRRLLMERKEWKTTRGARGYPVPVIAVIEEAHVLIPRDEDTLSKYWAGRVAREGRKFGVGLVLVSQRPKNVDQDVLSQTNNKIILRIVEPQDQRYVQAASEQLSDDLMRLLPSLNPGEAIVIGGMAKLPALVKIDLCPARTGGTDIDFRGEWERYARNSSDIVLEELSML